MADVLSEAIVKIRSTFDNSGTKEANNAMSNLASSAKQLGTLFGGAFALHGITNLIEQSVKFGGSIADMSQKLGISSDTLQEYGFVAEKAGISTEVFAKGISFLNANIGEAQKGNKTAVESFKAMGISLRDGAGEFKSLETILDEVPDGLNKLKTNSQKVAVAGKLFGRSGKQSALILAQGSKEIRAQITALRAYGGVLSNETARGLDEVDDRLLLVNKGWQVFKAELTFGFKDAILTAVSFLKRFTDGFKNLEKQFGILKPILFGLGIAIAAALAPAIIAGAPVIATFLLLGFLVDDLIALFSGGKSIIGAFLVEMLGFETAKKLIKETKETFKEFMDFVDTDGADVIKRFGLILAAPFRLIGDLIKDAIIGMEILAQISLGNFKGALASAQKLVLPGANAVKDIANTVSLGEGAVPGIRPDLLAAAGSPSLALAGPAPFGPRISNSNAQNIVSTTFNIQSNDPHEVRYTTRRCDIVYY